MKHKTLTWVVGVVATVAPIALGASWMASGCSQPAIDCRAAHGSFAVRYTWVSGDPDCGALTTGIVGLQSYYGASNGEQDYNHALLAVQSDVLGYLLWTSQAYGTVDVLNKPYGLGDFASTEPTGDVCSVPALSLAEQNLVEVPPEGGAGPGGGGAGPGGGGAGPGGGGAGGAAGGAGGAVGGAGGAVGGAGGVAGAGGQCPEPPPPGPDPGMPATDVKFQWSNVKLIVRASAPGTQFVADLAYSETIGDASCSANYKVVGIWPVVDCGIYTYDDCGNLVDAQPNDGACRLDPMNAPPGSVIINPDFNVPDNNLYCDPGWDMCVVNAPVAELQ